MVVFYIILAVFLNLSSGVCSDIGGKSFQEGFVPGDDKHFTKVGVGYKISQEEFDLINVPLKE